MARVPYVDQKDLPDGYRDLLDRPENIFRALANSPDLLRAYMQFGMWMRTECQLEPRLRELAILQVSYSTGSEYEFSHHVKIGADYGVTDQDIRSLLADNTEQPSELGKVEQLVLRASRQMTDEGSISDHTWAALSGHLDAARMVELVMVVTFYGCVARVLSVLRVDVEPEYLGRLETYSFPPKGRS